MAVGWCNSGCTPKPYISSARGAHPPPLPASPCGRPAPRLRRSRSHMEVRGSSAPRSQAGAAHTTAAPPSAEVQVFTCRGGVVEAAPFERSLFLDVTEDHSALEADVRVRCVTGKAGTLSVVVSALDEETDDNSDDAAGQRVLFGRSPIDPIVALQQTRVPWRARFPHVKLAAVVVVASREGHILLTRRAAQMRSFPHAWVLPGGHVDSSDASLEAAARREVREETGLCLPEEAFELLGCWESSFPPIEDCLKLEPVRVAHHALMLCFKTTVDSPSLEHLELDPAEVDFAAWVPEEQLRDCLGDWRSEERVSAPSVSSAEVVHGVHVQRSEEGGVVRQPGSLPLAQLSGVYPNTLGEGVGRAHSFILRHHLSRPTPRACASL